MQRSPHEDLSAYLDGELTDAEATELEAELARDPELRAELTELEGVVAWMRREGPENAPFGFRRRVMDRVEEADRPKAGWWAWWRRPFGIPVEGWVVAAAAAAVLFLAVPRESSDEGVAGNWSTADDEQRGPAAVALPSEIGEGQVGEVVEPPTPTKGGASEQGVAGSGQVGAKPTLGSAVPKTTSLAAEGPAKGVQEGLGEEAPGTEQLEEQAVAPYQPAEPGYGVVLQSTDPNMKRRVMAVASRFGRPRLVDGTEPTSAAFQASRETLLVDIPQKDLTAFEKALDGLGYGLAGADDRELLRGAYVTVRIEVVLEGYGAKSVRSSKGGEASEALTSED